MTVAMPLRTAENFTWSTSGAANLPRRRNGSTFAPLCTRNEIRYFAENIGYCVSRLRAKADDLQLCSSRQTDKLSEEA
jgi:hypothetical protein